MGPKMVFRTHLRVEDTGCGNIHLLVSQSKHTPVEVQVDGKNMNQLNENN